MGKTKMSREIVGEFTVKELNELRASKNEEVTILNQQLARYVDGQIEIQNPYEEYLYRGEIKKIRVESDGNGGELRVKFSWLKKMEDWKWKYDPVLDYAAGLIMYSHSDIGEGRLAFRCPINHELAVLFPKEGSRLEGSKNEARQELRIARRR